jgi:hypothetical protein
LLIDESIHAEIYAAESSVKSGLRKKSRGQIPLWIERHVLGARWTTHKGGNDEDD